MGLTLLWMLEKLQFWFCWTSLTPMLLPSRPTRTTQVGEIRELCVARAGGKQVSVAWEAWEHLRAIEFSDIIEKPERPHYYIWEQSSEVRYQQIGLSHKSCHFNFSLTKSCIQNISRQHHNDHHHLANATNFWDSTMSIKIIVQNLKYVSYSNSVYVSVEIR